MKLTAEMRAFLRERELLPRRLRKRLDRDGLFHTADLLDELLILFWDLNTKLERIDSEQETVLGDLQKGSESVRSTCPDVATAELFAAVLALEEVFSTLERRAVASNALERLHKALLGLVHDSSPSGMLMPTQRTHRPVDSPATQIAKGMLAAAVHVRQKTAGATRTQAASWVLRHTSPELLRCISRKPIKQRTMIEWVDRYSGKHAAPGFAESAFRSWTSNFAAWSSTSRFNGDLLRHVTKNQARRLPVLAA